MLYLALILVCFLEAKRGKFWRCRRCRRCSWWWWAMAARGNAIARVLFLMFMMIIIRILAMIDECEMINRLLASKLALSNCPLAPIAGAGHLVCDVRCAMANEIIGAGYFTPAHPFVCLFVYLFACGAIEWARRLNCELLEPQVTLASLLLFIIIKFAFHHDQDAVLRYLRAPSLPGNQSSLAPSTPAPNLSHYYV